MKKKDKIYNKIRNNLVKTLFYYKDNCIERFIKNKLFDKNVLRIIDEF